MSLDGQIISLVVKNPKIFSDLRRAGITHEHFTEDYLVRYNVIHGMDGLRTVLSMVQGKIPWQEGSNFLLRFLLGQMARTPKEEGSLRSQLQGRKETLSSVQEAQAPRRVSQKAWMLRRATRNLRAVCRREDKRVERSKPSETARAWASVQIQAQPRRIRRHVEEAARAMRYLSMPSGEETIVCRSRSQVREGARSFVLQLQSCRRSASRQCEERKEAWRIP